MEETIGRGPERFILVGVSGRLREEAAQSLDELEELTKAAGAEAVGRVLQSLERPDPVTYVGSGKLLEIEALLDACEADGIICDDELSTVQLRELADALGCKIMDRTLLILDIFAMRARTKEGRLQVELAQLQYRLSRLAGAGKAMSRLGGGIGTRGPGEKKLETDRRRIRRRITSLKRELAEGKAHRELLRDGRKRGLRPVVSLVGYTNAGKSTLFNALTGAGVGAVNRLFDTLDSTTRVTRMPDGQEILLTDTVGFIRKLPHHLVEAFRSTLEETAKADVIVHVADLSCPRLDEQMHVVAETLHDLGVKGTPIITVLNKADRPDADPVRSHAPGSDYTLRISALTGQGLDQLMSLLSEVTTRDQVVIERLYSYEDAGKLSLIRRYGQIYEEEYLEEGIRVRACVPLTIYGNV